MKRLLIIPVILFVLGCTSPTQRIAVDAMHVAMQQDANIVHDLSTIAWQQSLDLSALEVEDAVKSGDVNKAKIALIKFSDNLSTVSFLRVENEKNRALFRIAQQFIFGQRGILDIVIEDLTQAKKNSDAKNPAPINTQTLVDQIIAELNKSVVTTQPVGGRS